MSSVASAQLRSMVERIERLEEEKAGVADDIKAVYAEAKANGYDTRTLRRVVRLRKQDTNERAEQEALLDLYLSALGMLAEVEVDSDALERSAARAAARREAYGADFASGVAP